MKQKIFIFLPVFGLFGLLIFSTYNLNKKNKKTKNSDKFFKNLKPKYPQNIAACECEFNLN